MMRDFQDLSLLANAVRTNYTVLYQAALALDDTEMEELAQWLGDHAFQNQGVDSTETDDRRHP